MNPLNRLGKDHDEILAELRRMESLLDGLKGEEVPRLISRLWALLEGLRKHEEFEEQILLAGLVKNADAKNVERARREHDDVLKGLTALHQWLSSGLAPMTWTEGLREMIRVLAGRVYEMLRGHIRWENETLLGQERREEPPEERESWRRWS